MTEAQAAELLELVREIRHLLVAMVLDEAERTGECGHPDEARVDLSTPNDRGHWVCGICRFDNKAAECRPS